jgi:hypothetical protein
VAGRAGLGAGRLAVVSLVPAYRLLTLVWFEGSAEPALIVAGFAVQPDPIAPEYLR